MRLITVALMAGLLLTLPASAQRMRGRQMQASSFAGGMGKGQGKAACDGTGPKHRGQGKGCQRGAGQCLRAPQR